jgi:hypothetical protein
VTVTDPDELLRVARDLCDRPSAELAGRWPRAAAIVARAALEAVLDEYWRTRAPDVAEVLAARAKMLCLSAYLGDDDLAHSTYESWASLSHACHRHAYELEPTADELGRWIGRVVALREQLPKR